MGNEREIFTTMSDQDSAVVYQIRPDDLMGELGIKKDAYYAYLKFLGIKAEKDDGKAYLSESQANLIRALRLHVETTGKMEGFVNSNGELAIAEGASLLDAAAQAPEAEAARPGYEEELIRAAAELRGQQLVMEPLVIRELASRMSYDDLPEDVRAKVDAVRESASPKFHPQAIADSILDQWRNRNQQPATA
jgi:hypothetical protein